MDDPQYLLLKPSEVRARYVTLTDTLIHRIEGHEQLERPLHLLFLDKSGRPVAWLIRALWPVLARRPGTDFTAEDVPRLPTMSFANIDREQWWDITGATEAGHIDVDRVPRDTLAGLRAAYLRKRPSTTTEIWDASAWLDDRTILVIDEVINTGDTLTIATGLVQRAFPSSTVEGAHWMSPGNVRDARSGQLRVVNVPLWYRDDTWRGRLIGNRHDPAHTGTSWRGLIGTNFMSTVPPERDHDGVRLRTEIGLIATEVGTGKLLAVPSSARELDDVVARIHGLYGYDDPREFTLARTRAGC